MSWARRTVKGLMIDEGSAVAHAVPNHDDPHSRDPVVSKGESQGDEDGYGVHLLVVPLGLTCLRPELIELPAPLLLREILPGARHTHALLVLGDTRPGVGLSLFERRPLYRRNARPKIEPGRGELIEKHARPPALSVGKSLLHIACFELPRYHPVEMPGEIPVKARPGFFAASDSRPERLQTVALLSSERRERLPHLPSMVSSRGGNTKAKNATSRANAF